jgi:hypothetical protein
MAAFIESSPVDFVRLRVLCLTFEDSPLRMNLNNDDPLSSIVHYSLRPLLTEAKERVEERFVSDLRIFIKGIVARPGPLKIRLDYFEELSAVECLPSGVLMSCELTIYQWHV